MEVHEQANRPTGRQWQFLVIDHSNIKRREIEKKDEDV